MRSIINLSNSSKSTQPKIEGVISPSPTNQKCRIMKQKRRLTGYVLVDPFDGAILCQYPVGLGFDGDCVSAKMEAIHDAEERKVKGCPMEVYGCINNTYSDGTRIYPRN